MEIQFVLITCGFLTEALFVRCSAQSSPGPGVFLLEVLRSQPSACVLAMRARRFECVKYSGK